MARLCVDLGRVNSKYDCVLGANLNPAVPVDRHVFVKRIRVWANADGFHFAAGFQEFGRRSRRVRPPSGSSSPMRAMAARWKSNCARKCPPAKTRPFFSSAGRREKCAHGKQLPAKADVRLTVRFDIEDRNFHAETKRNGGADFHFSSNTQAEIRKRRV